MNFENYNFEYVTLACFFMQTCHVNTFLLLENVPNILTWVLRSRSLCILGILFYTSFYIVLKHKRVVNNMISYCEQYQMKLFAQQRDFQVLSIVFVPSLLCLIAFFFNLI